MGRRCRPLASLHEATAAAVSLQPVQTDCCIHEQIPTSSSLAHTKESGRRMHPSFAPLSLPASCLLLLMSSATFHDGRGLTCGCIRFVSHSVDTTTRHLISTFVCAVSLIVFGVFE
jgi:hypothetical protein